MKDKLILSILLNENSIDFLSGKKPEVLNHQVHPHKMLTNSARGMHVSDSLPKSSQMPSRKDAYPDGK